ncbi:MAG: hypothetical protein JXR05_15150 [Flavobacteriaceae bacterium]
MKKIIGVLGMLVFALTMFVNTGSNDMNLSNSVTINNAEAKIICQGQWVQTPNGIAYVTECENTNCVCKSGGCFEANFISFRRSCGDTAHLGFGQNTDENCDAIGGGNC